MEGRLKAAGRQGGGKLSSSPSIFRPSRTEVCGRATAQLTALKRVLAGKHKNCSKPAKQGFYRAALYPRIIGAEETSDGGF